MVRTSTRPFLAMNQPMRRLGAADFIALATRVKQAFHCSAGLPAADHGNQSPDASQPEADLGVADAIGGQPPRDLALLVVIAAGGAGGQVAATGEQAVAERNVGRHGSRATRGLLPLA